MVNRYIQRAAHDLSRDTICRRFHPSRPHPVTRVGWQICEKFSRTTSMEFPWLRWWDAQGNLVLDGTEIAQLAQAQSQMERAERLAERLRAMGVNPDELT
ncbi:hypothetical protein [Trichocoleus sp. FACHB-40]|uniref:hypothetical protein n=1 Tax=Trichocoleus sp. FACHB-40 TaxID=2692870 RepID=UPI0016825713|nr:hypothetical protein [Trichocoleus sp. FACHB-40]MBD2004316.1 hypothetical protein [Trichocoleus sp. FACHB-40]